MTLRDTEEHTREQLSELAKWADLRRNASIDARGLGPPSHVRGRIEPVEAAEHESGQESEIEVRQIFELEELGGSPAIERAR